MASSNRIHLLITLAGIVLYLPFLGSFHLFDWDEINFAEAAREMLVTGDWSRPTIGFEAFWEKPPLFIWLQALCMKIFGVNEFAARLPNALAGVISLNLFYFIGRRHISHFFGIFFVLAYAGSLAPGLYFKTGIIDPVFNLFIFLSVYQLFCAEDSKTHLQNPRIHYLLTGFFAGLAVLTKGPVALLLIGLVALVRIIIQPKTAWPGFGNLFITLCSFIITGSSWPLTETLVHGPKFITDFWNYQLVLFGGQIEWHNQPWFYHFIVLFFLAFPASVFALPNILYNRTAVKTENQLIMSYMRILFWVVLIVFSIVTTKIIHYSSLCWIPLSFISAYYLYGIYTNREKLLSWLSVPVFLSMLPVALISLVAPVLLATDKNFILNLLKKDPFATAMLSTSELWSVLYAVPGAILLGGMLYACIHIIKGNKIAVYSLFAITLLFAQLVYALIIPKAEQLVQGSIIATIEDHNKKQAYLENWHYKSFAYLFYGNMKPADFKGPWDGMATRMQGENQPVQSARKLWLMDSTVAKPVFIVTKSDYKTDEKFRQNFKLIKPVGAYLMWQRTH